MKLFLTSLMITGVALGDAVTDWNRLMLVTINAENPPSQARFAAITHLAVFEAVNAISKNYQPYLGGINAAPTANPEAAAVAAAHQVLVHYFPASAATLDPERVRSLGAIPDGAEKSAGIAAGHAAAAAMIARRATDGAGTPVPYTPRNGIGWWQPTPPALAAGSLQHWGRVPPFGLERADQFRPARPPELTSREYRRDYNEVKEAGSDRSIVRPQALADIARFSAATSPVQIWNTVAGQLSAAQRLSLSENARAYALLNMAICDAAIAVFEAKYVYQFWRPVTAIRAGGTDGNPRTDPDPGFSSFLVTPPYPSHPSGFGGLSNAGRKMLETVFGNVGHSITLTHATLPGLNLHYTRLRRITDDAADARVYGGIHFRFEQEASEVLGVRIAEYIESVHLRCARPGGCEDSVPVGDER